MNPFAKSTGVVSVPALRAAVALAAVLLAVFAGPALGDYGVASFDGSVLKVDGSAATQAGSHPWEMSTTITFRSHPDPDLPFFTVPEEDTKDIFVDLPPGLIGNSNAVPKCTEQQLAETNQCPPATQIGVLKLVSPLLDAFSGTPNGFPVPVYNMVAPPGVPAEFAFQVIGIVTHMDAHVRAGDYGVSVDLSNISQAATLVSTTLTLWGVPADPTHDALRGFDPATGFACALLNEYGTPCSNAAGVPRAAFLTLPTSCTPPGVGLETKLSADSWLDPGNYVHASFFSHLPPPDEATQQGPDGCDRVPFEASMDAQPVSHEASAPTGFQFDLKMPQSDNPDGLANAHLKKAVVHLPQGVVVSPSASDGLQACASAQIGIGNTDDPTCPDASKIGSVSIDTPLLSDPMAGSIYLAKQGDNPFGSLLAIYLVAKGPGVIVKLPGKIETNATTGQLTATFDDNPQLPFSRLLLTFNGGPRAALANPAQCGTYTTTADLSSWSGASLSSTSSFTIDHGPNATACGAQGFTPHFSAGTTNPSAGHDSPFTLTFGRDDGDRLLKDISVQLPQGLLGRISSTTLCSDAAANAGTCGAASRIGTTTTAAGPGSHPFYLPGSVSITGPYKGAPFGLSIVVPAVAGPFDLGTVVVRAAIFVDRTTAALRIVSDPLPTILQGIPLQLRSVNVAIDRPGFMFNPTSCRVTGIAGTIGSYGGAGSDVRSRFQVGGCATLPYAPRMSIVVGGRRHTRKGASIPTTVVLRQGAGQANNKAVDVTFPSSINARLAALQHPCSQAGFDAGTCSKASKVGTASAVTPILRDPLRGSAYFVVNPKGGLPLLKVALRGQVSVDLTGVVSTPHGRLIRTQFKTVPDVPISRFRLSIVGGSQGPLGATRNLCTRAAKAARARVAFRAQSGKLVRIAQRLKVAGCGRASHR